MQFAAAAIAAEVEQELREIIAWWSTHAVDLVHGGFHGEVDNANCPIEEASKGSVLHARILWFFSEAAAHTGDQKVLDLANRARDYLVERFIDPMHGGVWWELSADGAPVNRRKHAQAQALAVQALAAHFGVTGAPRSCECAHELFGLLEKHFRDTRHGGWIEARGEDWRTTADQRLNPQDANAPKSASTHVQVLEALTSLHRAAPTDDTAQALRHAIEIFGAHMIGPAAAHVRLFFGMDWRDQSPGVSFGHDIQTSWLLWEAADALGDASLRAYVRPIALGLARVSRAEGRGPDGGVYFERAHGGHFDRRRVWWAQAEALVGYLNAYELTEDDAYFDTFFRVWRFIKTRLKHESGEWTWWSSIDASSSGEHAYKAGFWKGPYHNGRAMIETTRRLRRILESGKGSR